MKKWVLIFLFVFLMVGCGNDKTELDMSSAKGAIEKSLSNMVTIEDSTLSDAYNLDLKKMDEWTFKQNENGDFYAIIKTSNKVDVKDAMKGYFAKVKDFNSSYSPERLELLENRLEKELGDYLIYIIAENSENIYKDVLNTIK